MVTERRYARYRHEDVLMTVYQMQRPPSSIPLKVYNNTVTSRSVMVSYKGKEYHAVILARSSDWYRFSLNCTERWHHDITAALVGTHDSCLPIPCWACDTIQWYQPLALRMEIALQSLDEKGNPNDAFEEFRRTHYGHNIFIGALMCGRLDARQRLVKLPASTRFRIEAKLRRLRNRRQGRPLKVSV